MFVIVRVVRDGDGEGVRELMGENEGDSGECVGEGEGEGVGGGILIEG